MSMSVGNWTSYNGTGDFETLQFTSDIVTRIVAPTMYAIVTVAGLVGNSLVIYMLLGYTKMQNASDHYILNLAMADVLFMLGVPFHSAASAMQRWVFGKAMCKIILSVEALNMFSSVFNLAVLSVDRYLAIVCATTHPHLRRPRVASAVSLSVWLTAILVTSPVIAVSDTILMEDGNYICILNWPEHRRIFWYKAFTSYTFILGFVVPLVVISVSYLMVVRHLRRSTSAHTEVSRVSIQTRVKVTKMVTAMIVTFVVCWLPFHLCQIINLVVRLRPTQAVLVLFHAAVAMSYLNSCANPILYAFMSQKFRESFRAALCLTPSTVPASDTDRRTRRNGNGVYRGDGATRTPQDRDDSFEEVKCEVNTGNVRYSAPQEIICLFVTTV